MSLEKNVRAEYERRSDKKLAMIVSNNEKMCYTSGYSISGENVKCTSCSKPSNRDDWNDYLMVYKVCN